MVLIDSFTSRPQSQGENRHKIPSNHRLLKQPHTQVVPSSPIRQQPPRLHKKTFSVPVRRIGRVKLALQMIAILVLSAALGLAAGNQLIGTIAVALYALVALGMRFSSRSSFALAVLAFFMLMFMEIIRPTSSLAANFAVYAFLLLVVGTVSLSLEVRQEAKWEKWRKRSK